MPIFPQVIPEVNVDQSTATLQPAVTPGTKESDPVTPRTPAKNPNSVAPASQKKALGNPVKSRQDAEVIVVKGGNVSFQPTSHETKSGRKTQLKQSSRTSDYLLK